MGSCFASKTVSFPDFKTNVRYEIWDTAGQEQYRSLSKIFYKDSNVAILVYDVARIKSFEEIKNYWYQQIKENASKKISNELYFKK
jgi:small GTP-binding protein